MENWKDIEGYEGSYQVSDLGNVRSLDRKNSRNRKCKGKNMRLSQNVRNGYLYVRLWKNGKSINASVHRLVACAFVENPERKSTVNHKNENKQDNRAENLEWLTLQENLQYGTHTERATQNKPSMLGKNHFNFGKRGAEAVTHKGAVVATSVFDKNKTLVFDTAATTARELGISSGQLCETLKGKYKTCAGYYWRREDG